MYKQVGGRGGNGFRCKSDNCNQQQGHRGVHKMIYKTTSREASMRRHPTHPSNWW